MYLLAADRLQIQASRCLAVEDSAPGIAAAKAAGMPTVGIPSYYTRRQDLSQADVLVAGFPELFQFLFKPT